MSVTRWRAGWALGIVCASQAIGGQTPVSPALSSAQQCEVDRVALQAQVVELRAQLVALQTQIDREALARERARIESTLPTLEGQRWDWTTLRFVPGPGPEKGTTPR